MGTNQTDILESISQDDIIQNTVLESSDQVDVNEQTTDDGDDEKQTDDETASETESARLASRSMKILNSIISVLLVVTGSINTLAAKWADEVKIDGRYFSHPFFQATVMFLGEICCMFVYFTALLIQRWQWTKRQRSRLVDSNGAVENNKVVRAQPKPTLPRFNYFLFAMPAVCDVVATSLQYVGLTLTSASSYQMLRGAVIIFTGLLSMLCLHAKLRVYRWIGMLVVVIGLVIVGVADLLYADDFEGKTKTQIVIGDVLIVVSQVVVAVQMVVEQKLLTDSDCPALLAVGLEGIFGFLVLSVAMIPMYFIHVPSIFSGSPLNRLEDALDAFQQMHKSPQLVGALCCTLVSIAFFNFAGISLTKYMSATTRMVLDSVRTIVIWAVSIPLFHNNLIPLQIVGFVFLVTGMFVYNDVLIGPTLRKTKLGAKLYSESKVQDARL